MDKFFNQEYCLLSNSLEIRFFIITNSFYTCQRNIIYGPIYLIFWIINFVLVFLINIPVLSTKALCLASLKKNISLPDRYFITKLTIIPKISLIIQNFYLLFIILLFYALSILPTIYYIYYLNKEELIFSSNVLHNLSNIFLFFWNSSLSDKVQICFGKNGLNIAFFVLLNCLILFLLPFFINSQIMIYDYLYMIFHKHKIYALEETFFPLWIYYILC